MREGPRRSPASRLGFYRVIGRPRTPLRLGLAELHEEKLPVIAGPACRMPYPRNIGAGIGAPILIAALGRADGWGEGPGAAQSLSPAAAARGSSSAMPGGVCGAGTKLVCCAIGRPVRRSMRKTVKPAIVASTPAI